MLRHLPTDRFPLPSATFESLVHGTEDMSAADICKLCEHIKRQTILKPDEGLATLALVELFSMKPLNTAKEKKEAARTLKASDQSLTTRRIAQVLGTSASSVSRYLKETSYMKSRPEG
jgi:hypothetical protein